MAPAPLDYEPPAAPAPRPAKPPGDPAAGLSGLLVAVLTLCLYFAHRLLVPHTEPGLFVLAMTLTFWPLGFGLSAVGLARPGGRRFAAGGVAVSALSAVLVARAAGALLR